MTIDIFCLIYKYILYTQILKVGVRLKLGFLPDPKGLEKRPVHNPKVGVRPKLGFGLK